MKEYLVHYKIAYQHGGANLITEGNSAVYLFNEIKLENIPNIQKNILEGNKERLYSKVNPEQVLIVNIMKLGE